MVPITSHIEVVESFGEHILIYSSIRNGGLVTAKRQGEPDLSIGPTVNLTHASGLAQT